MELMELFLLDKSVRVSFSRYILDPGYTDNSLHYHSDLEISYVKSGKGLYSIGGEEYEINSGDIVILKSFEHHYISKILSEEPLVNIVLMANPQFIRFANEKIYASNISPLLSKKTDGDPYIFRDEAIVKHFESIESLLEEKKELNAVIVKCEVYTLFARVLQFMAKNCGKENCIAVDEISIKINKILSYIDGNILDKLMLDELAEMVGLNATYLSHCFKKHTGISITEYILQNRISLSIKKLQSTKMNIKDIALECGFNNTANFNKAFRTIIGKTPSEIRNLNNMNL